MEVSGCLDLLMVRVTSFRSLISLLLAAWMPFCCCSLHSLVSSCEPCAGQGPDIACHGHGEASDHDLAPGHHHDDEETTPAQPDKPGHDDGPCTCDKQKQTTVGVEKTTIEFPTPVLAYELPDWDLSTLPFLRPFAFWCENQAVHKPTASLLRQHCALIV